MHTHAPAPISLRSLGCSFGLPILDLWHVGLRASPDQFEKTGYAVNGGRCVVHAEGHFFVTTVGMAVAGLARLLDPHPNPSESVP